ncbi:MAG: hypothetical protein FWG87_08575 [Defluviitaleaceae bacterium]|nr:hypothetical protein [Defluviitaleaceae bacterium]
MLIKQRISLYLACIIFLNILAVFIVPPAVALANDPLPSGGLGVGLPGTAFDGELRASFNASLVPAAGRPNFLMGTVPDGNILLNWPVLTPPGGTEFMQVLRYFDEHGNRHELSLRRITGFGEGAGLMVNYDIFVPIADGGGVRYVHISDPIRREMEMPNYQIFVPGLNTFETATAYLSTNNRNFPVQDTRPTTQLNRVNDRLRFDPDDTGTLFTAVYPSYPNNPNARSLPELASEDEFDTEHYNWLTPSFNIDEGYGYSFKVSDRTMHFRWEGGQFYFYAENILTTGNIHDFTLERYEGLTNINSYVRGNASGLIPAGNAYVSANEIPNTVNGKIYAFIGIDRTHLVSIPYAHNELIDEINTNPSNLAGIYEQGTGTATASNLHAPFPIYNTERLDMTAEADNGLRAAPAAGGEDGLNLGLDIRFNLPGFFDETTGGFTEHILTDKHTIGKQLGVSLMLMVGGAPTPEDFEVRVPLADMPNFAGDNNENQGSVANVWEATLTPREDRALVAGSPPVEMTLRDVSLLHRTDAEQADRVRIKVGGLSSSIAYERGLLSLSAGEAATNFITTSERQIASYDEPIYTFLDFRFDTLLGREVIIATPYNLAVTSLNRGHTIRTGYYQLVTTSDPRGFAPFLATEASTEVYFSLPTMIIEPWDFQITMSQAFPLPPEPPNMLYSQIVRWQPNREPRIDIPSGFTVSNVLHKPMREPAEGFDRFQAGELSFTAEWNIATFADIMARLGHPDDTFGTSSSALKVSYVVGISTSPETQAMIKDGETQHMEYLYVDMEIRRVMGEDGTYLTDRVEVRYLDSSDFIPPRYQGEIPTPHPILNRDSVVGWQEVIPRPDPSIGENVLIASIDIITNSVRLHRIPPPPQHMRRDFHFPGIYFMNVRLNDWGYVGSPVLGGETPWSLFDYLVIEDIPELEPPPPTALEIKAGPTPPVTTQPFMDVSYAIPTRAITAYLNTQYQVSTQITTNVYIGRFEDALMDTFFPFAPPPDHHIRRTLEPQYRPTRAYSIDFDDPRLGASYVGGRTELDLSNADIQRILRGEVTASEPDSGVIRITGVPLIQNMASTTGPALDIALQAGTPLNFAVNEGLTMEQSFTATRAILNSPSDFPVYLRLTNLDENSAYYIFTDMEIEKWLDETGEWQLFDEGENPAISTLTGVATDTTVGTPELPTVGDTDPTAPQVRVRDVEQMAASIYWGQYGLSFQERTDGVKVEWEMIRVQNGDRMTNDQLTSRNPIFTDVFNSLTSSPLRMGWVSDGKSLTHFTTTANQLIAEPNEGEDFEWYPQEVELRDKTLLPNNLYFYYVRTVRIEEAWDDQLQGYVATRSVSTWSEATVTTYPVSPPINLRQEDATGRAGYDGKTMALVSWTHQDMDLVLDGMGELFLFEYQIREGEDEWRSVVTISPNIMGRDRLLAGDSSRITFMLAGLQHSSVYQMRVRLRDMSSDETSLWSNIINIMTEIDEKESGLDGQVDNWLNYLRRKLEEILRQPYWTAQDSAWNNTFVYRPAEVFDGLMASAPDTAIPLHTQGASRTVYYIPTSAVLTANENRRGFSAAFGDMQLLFAPSFLNTGLNQPVMNMLRDIDARGSSLSDSFVRVTVDRTTLGEINSAPAITPSTTLSMEIVATNDKIRNIRSWDRTMLNTARDIVEDWLNDPIVQQGIRDLLISEAQNEEISDHIYHVIGRVEAEIREAVNEAMVTHTDGILAPARNIITDFNAPLHVVATNVTENMSVSGYRRVNNNWQFENLIEYAAGRAFVTHAVGTFAFSGRVVDIPDIETIPRGNVVVGIVARYGLEDLFGVNIDMKQNASRQMVVGSIARAAGIPRGSDAFAWANASLNVNMSSRNATGLISWQEAVAVTMALYEHRTSTPISTMRITNFANTAAMTLDTRYAQAVRAAFELGVVSDSARNPAGSVSIGEFLDMLTLLSGKVGV